MPGEGLQIRLVNLPDYAVQAEYDLKDRAVFASTKEHRQASGRKSSTLLISCPTQYLDPVLLEKWLGGVKKKRADSGTTK